jgi:hypothetical protein
VQLAYQKGHDLLLQGDVKAAVEVLERQLSRINGNRQYLALLRDAYRQYVKDLSLKNRQEDLNKYAERLRILDGEDGAAPSVADATIPKETNTVPSIAPQDGPEEKAAVYRGKSDDPFSMENESKEQPPALSGHKRRPMAYGAEDRRAHDEDATRRTAVGKLLEQAEEAFTKRRFDQARRLYEQAHEIDARAAARGREQWAYCKLHRVVEEMKQTGPAKASWTELEQEVQAALRMSPRLDSTGKWLLKEINKRRGGSGASDEGTALTRINVKHLSKNAQGWYVAETANFRIFHNQSRELVHKVALAAEQTRLSMSRKWFGSAGNVWSPRCDVYLHDDGRAYARATGVPANSPGHSRIETDGERVVSRRIDVHCDNPNMLKAVLPHETTHVVLAGQFGKHPVPRWADEGMAVLTEPADKVSLHLKNLRRCRQSGQLFAVRELMQLGDYPQPRRVGAFYAQSVSLVDYLTKRRGSVVFAQFLRDALRDGYEPALRKYYRFRDFDELQESWSRDAFDKPLTYSASKKRYAAARLEK